jgi:hypothetical protein
MRPRWRITHPGQRGTENSASRTPQALSNSASISAGRRCEDTTNNRCPARVMAILSLRVFVNGTLRAEATDPSLTPFVCSAGVATYKAAVDFDNFSLMQP